MTIYDAMRHWTELDWALHDIYDSEDHIPTAVVRLLDKLTKAVQELQKEATNDSNTNSSTS